MSTAVRNGYGNATSPSERVVLSIRYGNVVVWAGRSDASFYAQFQHLMPTPVTAAPADTS